MHDPIFIHNQMFTEMTVAALMPMLEQSKTFMDPSGGVLIDKLMSDIPIFKAAMAGKDLPCIHRILEETQKSMNTMLPHITHAEFHNLAVERIDAFNSIVTCIQQGKCGFRAYIHYLCGCIDPLKTMYTFLSD